MRILKIPSLLMILFIMLFFGCAEHMSWFKYGDKIVSDGGRPGTVVDIRDAFVQIEALVRWDDDLNNPKWLGVGLIHCAEVGKCGRK